jgi:dolichol-phosphate mannosyltransferase
VTGSIEKPFHITMNVFSLRPAKVIESVSGALLVVLPVYNESANIADVVNEWIPALDALPVGSQMLLINDGSTDDTFDILQSIALKYGDRLIIVDKLNAGHGSTCRLGYEIAAASKCEWVLQIDSDGQCDAGYLKDFWQHTETSDFILGTRVRRDDGFSRLLTSKICRWLSSVTLGVNLPDPNVPYRLMRRKALSEILRLIPGNFNVHNVALSYCMYKRGTYKVERVPIVFRCRAGGTNSINMRAVISMGGAMLFELAALRRSKH